MRLARQVGHPVPERAATYNLAEDLYWSGEDDDEAHELALHASDLARTFIDKPVAEDALLVARTALARGDCDTALEYLSWVEERFQDSALVGASRCFADMLTLVLGGGTEGDWKRLLAESKELAGDDRLELLYWRSRECGSTREASREIADLLRRFPIWQRRFEALEAGH
jgi:nucleotide-binding universal stress UspA family protein